MDDVDKSILEPIGQVFDIGLNGFADQIVDVKKLLFHRQRYIYLLSLLSMNTGNPVLSRMPHSMP